jgi:uncharacterized protein
MSASSQTNPSRGLARLAPPIQWGVLLVASGALAAGFKWIGLPASLLLGPMVAGIAIGANHGAIRVALPPYYAAQAVVGCLIARAITPTIFSAFLQHGLLFLTSIAAVIAASSLLGWLMSRWGVLPGSTAIWGSSPGAASAMMVMAEAYGADAQTVALMQYLRVVFVAAAASMIARIWVGSPGAVHEIAWFAPIRWTAFAETLILAGLGTMAGRLLRVPAGPLLTPLAAGAVLHVTGLIEIELPQWLLAASYALIGWSIGLRFTRPILVHAARALPQIILSIVILIAFCWMLAFALTAAIGVDPLTAYLATSPGGMDTVAIIASSSPSVDVSFVMAMQTVRFLAVILLGPALARLLADRIEKSAP